MLTDLGEVEWRAFPTNFRNVRVMTDYGMVVLRAPVPGQGRFDNFFLVGRFDCAVIVFCAF